MRDLTSTKREFTALAQRLYRRGPLSVNRAFRGVIESGFGVWIREHWGLLNPGLFRPVEREFQTPKKPFALLNWPQPKRSGAANYTFSPTIHLTCFPRQTNNSFFELDAAGILQTLTLKQSSATRDEVLRNVLVEGADRRSRDYRFLERIFHTFNRESHRSVQSTKLKEFISSLFSTVSRTVGEVTRSRDIERSFWSKWQGFDVEKSFRSEVQRFDSERSSRSETQRFDRERNLRNEMQRFDVERSLRSETQRFDVERSLQSEMQRFEGTTTFRRDFALVRPASATKEVRNHFFTLRPSLITRFSNGDTVNGKTVSPGRLSAPSRLQRTTNLQTRLDHQFLTSAKNVKSANNFHYGQNVFTTLALNFAAPKVSEIELVEKRIAQFVSSPELTHIKRQQAVSEEMINALRALRTPYVESKPVPVPVMPSIEQLTNQVRTELERELRIERERRGI